MHATWDLNKGYMMLTAHMPLIISGCQQQDSQADVGALVLPERRTLTWGMASRGLKSMSAQ